MNDPVLEESFYWRDLTRVAAGDSISAIDDFRATLRTHSGFDPALEQLKRLGAELE